MNRLVCVTVLLAASATVAQEEPDRVWGEVPVELRANWHDVDEALVDQLDAARLGDLCRASLEEEPRDLAGALRQVSLLSRAGWEAELPDALERLHAVIDEREHGWLGYAFLDVLARRRQWEAAARGLELFPRAGAPNEVDLLLDALTTRRTPEAVEAWLVARTEAALIATANHPFGRAANGWRSARFRWHARRGTLQALVDAAMAAVRAQPEDTAHVRLLLQASDQLPDDSRDLDWLGEVCRPTTAFASYELGQELEYKVPSAAVPVLLHALELPFTAADQEAIQVSMVARCSAPPEWVRRDDWEPVLRRWTHDLLAKVLLELERPQEAQAHMEAGKALAEATGDVPDFRLAGLTQGASGARVVQGELLEQEAASADSPDYWLKRVDYFKGRQEWGEVEQAYLRALALLPREARESEGANAWWPRWHALNGYAALLHKTLGRSDEARTLLREELAALDPASGEATQVVSAMTSYIFSDLLDPSDELLWAVLEARPVWDYPEASLLRTVAGGGRLARAVALAEGSPTRAFEVGLLLVNRKQHKEGEALLRRARAELSEDAQRLERIDFALFESALDRRDWGACLGRWPAARARLTDREQPTWLTRMALDAAAQGEPGHALTFWRIKANADHTDLQGLDRLAEAGLRTHLRALYGEWAQAEPASRPLAEAVAALE